MTRPDLAWSYSELSKYVQFPGIAHMDAAEHVLQYLRDTWNELLHTLVVLQTLMNSGDGLTQIGMAIPILAVHTLATSL